MTIAASRASLLFELRAALSLYGVRASARDRLAGVVARFDGDDECADLRAARRALANRPT